MMNRTPMFLVLAITWLTPCLNAQSPKIVSYEEFAKLPEERQDALYATLGPENKAQLLRARFQRWLDENRTALTGRQASAVREAIDTVTPELFQNPQDPASVRRQVANSEKLYCALGSELAFAFAKDQPAKPVERTWSQSVRTWIDWMVECVVK